jgi:ribulose-bisphosphate carboxylase large chain
MYIDKNYSPDTKNDFALEFKASEKEADKITEQLTLGEWDLVNRFFPKLSVTLKPRVFKITEHSFFVAVPREHFELGIYNLIAMIAKIPRQLLSLQVPSRSLERMPGPRYGTQTLKELITRPLLAIPLRKEYGLTPTPQAQLAYELWSAGADIVIEDETLCDTPYNDFDDRVKKTLAMKQRVEKETKQRKFYIPNITAESAEMMRRADHIKRHQGDCAYVDLLTAGFSGIGTIRRHAHLFLMTKIRPYGMITEEPLVQLLQYGGIDIIGDLNKKAVFNANLKTPLQMIEAEPSEAPDILKVMENCIIEFSECYDHPDNMVAGVKAMRQVFEAVAQGIPLETYAARHRELDKALMKWG